MIGSGTGRRLVELACLAPSVHNTQPWMWELDGDRVRLRADRRRQLPVEDPSGRSLLISCGAALHHLTVAARALGLRTSVDRQPRPDDADLLAEIRLDDGAEAGSDERDLDILRRRCTDRRRFTSWPVPGHLLDRLADAAGRHQVSAQPITEPGARIRLELLAGRARGLRESDLPARREQWAWVARGAHDGVPAGALPAGDGSSRRPGARFDPVLAAEPHTVVGTGDGVIALGAPTDDPGAWLRTGEGLSALWLRATREGLSVVPLGLPVEVDAVRSELRHDVLAGSFAPHLLVRIGWQPIGRSDLPRTPRRPVAEVIEVVERAGRRPVGAAGIEPATTSL